MTYELLDCGNQEKLERFGDYLLVRPAPAALWKSALPKEEWKGAHARFSREEKGGWSPRGALPSSWILKTGAMHYKIAPTEFGHLGLFPEHLTQCAWIQKRALKGLNVLNLFAYSGAATLAAASAGAQVCHLDASKGMVVWARENAALNGLQSAPIRWIVDDVFKFLARESKRGMRYDGLILDPPSFGRGSKGECFKIECDLQSLLSACRCVLSSKPEFVIFSSHTSGFTPLVLQRLLEEMVEGFGGKRECDEMVIRGKMKNILLPSGAFARWSR